MAIRRSNKRKHWPKSICRLTMLKLLTCVTVPKWQGGNLISISLMRTNASRFVFHFNFTSSNYLIFLVQLEQSLVAARFEKEAWKNITNFNWKSFTDFDLKRQFKLLSVLGPSALPEDKFTQVKLNLITIVQHQIQ